MSNPYLQIYQKSGYGGQLVFDFGNDVQVYSVYVTCGSTGSTDSYMYVQVGGKYYGVSGSSVTKNATIHYNNYMTGTTRFTELVFSPTISGPGESSKLAIACFAGSNDTYIIIQKIEIVLEHIGIGSVTTTGSYSYNGSSKSVSYTVKDIFGNTISSSGYSASGTTSATNAGTYSYTITGKGDYTGSKTGNWTINKANLSSFAVSMSNWTYGSTASTPSVSGNSGSGTVTYKYKVSTAADNTYTTTKPSNAGTYTVQASVPATTNYNAGTATKNFTVSKYNISNATLASSISAQTYSGSQLKPSAPDIKMGSTVIANTNYAVSYGTNVTAGTNAGSVTYTANSSSTNFTGTKTANFTISKASGSISYGTNIAVTKTYGNAAFTNTLTKTGDGTVTYKSSNTGVATVNSSGQVTIVKPGTATITATVADGTNYSYSTKAVAYNLTVNQAAGSISYDTKTVAKTYGDAAFTNTLTKTGDGTVTYTSDNTGVATVNSSSGQVTVVSAGTATITATVSDGTNYAYATKTATYSLTVSPQASTITASNQSTTYNGEPQAYTNYVITAGTAAVTYYPTEGDRANGTNGTTTAPAAAGTYYMLVAQDNGNYSATPQNSVFTIAPLPKALTESAVHISPTSATYTGSDVTPTVTVDGLEATDYDVLWKLDGEDTEAPITAVGEYTATIRLKGNYTGSDFTAAQTFTVTRPIATGDVNGDGLVNITDVVALVNRIHGHPSSSFLEGMADMNGDGRINITDVVIMVNKIHEN